MGVKQFYKVIVNTKLNPVLRLDIKYSDKYTTNTLIEAIHNRLKDINVHDYVIVKIYNPNGYVIWP